MDKKGGGICTVCGNNCLNFNRGLVIFPIDKGGRIYKICENDLKRIGYVAPPEIIQKWNANPGGPAMFMLLTRDLEDFIEKINQLLK